MSALFTALSAKKPIGEGSELPNGSDDGNDIRFSNGPHRASLKEPGDHPVDVPIVCVITRFGLRSPRYLLPMYLNYRRVARDAARTPGLLRAAFLIENLKTCYSVSIWASPDAIPHFGTSVPFHVEAARRGLGWVSFHRGRGPEIWSTKWRLDSVSNNLNWGELDLRGLLLERSH